MDTPMSPPGGFSRPEFITLLGTARSVIDQHLNHDGKCAECGSIWPCQRAALAEFALSAM